MENKVELKKDNIFKKGFDKIKNFKLNRKVFAYPYVLFMILFIVVPLVMIIAYAFISDRTGAFTFGNFVTLAKDNVSLKVLWQSLLIGILTTLCCIVIGYPVAYIASKMKSGGVIIIFFLLPMWVNFLLRTLALKELFNSLNLSLGFGALLVGMVYNHLPFMILPIHTSLIGIDKSYAEAAKDLGASSPVSFAKVILPLTLPGIISGIIMVFIPTISSFAISEMLGGGEILLFGDSINAKVMHNQLGVASVMSLIMLLMVLVANVFISKLNKGNSASSLL
ncbi:MAG: ABC transporter permease [Christensenellales bacterium]|nr:ABC transporter permease [Clostridiales bacterium]